MELYDGLNPITDWKMNKISSRVYLDPTHHLPPPSTNIPRVSPHFVKKFWDFSMRRTTKHPVVV